jgi:O-antigen ligase
MVSVNSFAQTQQVPEPSARDALRHAASRAPAPSHPAIGLTPNTLVRWAFYLSIFAIPFVRIYIPGTGDRLGVTRIVQLLLICAVASQPRVCLRFVPVALLWVAGYCLVRLTCGVVLSPEWSDSWWPNTMEWLQFSLPWAWILFNLLQFPSLRRGGLWALIWGCSFCALLHVAGIGVALVDNGEEVRTTVFGENANVIGATYATALIALIGLSMLKDVHLGRRLLMFALLGVLGLAMAKTGSRTAASMVIVGVGVLLLQSEAFASRARRYASLGLIALVFAGIIWQVPTVMQRFTKVNSSNLNQQEGRVRMMPVMWEMFLRSPIYGSGPDAYQVELTRRAMPHIVQQRRTVAAHNLMLMLLVETGVIGLFLFVVAMGKALLAAWRARRLACGWLPMALLLPFVISAIVLSNPTHDHVFWLAMAYALAGAA